jgi:hypothetical protein
MNIVVLTTSTQLKFMKHQRVIQSIELQPGPERVFPKYSVLSFTPPLGNRHGGYYLLGEDDM